MIDQLTGVYSKTDLFNQIFFDAVLDKDIAHQTGGHKNSVELVGEPPQDRGALERCRHRRWRL
ncbi:MAG: hypothetical protein BWY75_01016 [bacterium ADurb.Bin425]|nr:MAG: hypothetical protein BWY75_01016 [bacterium ADurb.Bin425]